jgi:hypothetical protein
MFRCLSTLLASSLLLAQAPPAPRVPHPQGWTALVRSELTSHAIVRGVLRIRDRLAFDDAVQRGGGFAPLTIEVMDRLDGSAPKELELTCFVASGVAGRGVRPTAEKLLDYNQTIVIALIERVGQRNFLTDRAAGESLFEANATNLREVRALIQLHATLEKTPLPQPLSCADEIATILNEIEANPAMEVDGFQRIQDLGPSAFPALTTFLLDERKIRSPKVRVRGHDANLQPVVIAFAPRDFRAVLFQIGLDWAGEAMGLPRDVLDRQGHERRAVYFHVFAHYVLADERRRAEETKITANEDR